MSVPREPTTRWTMHSTMSDPYVARRETSSWRDSGVAPRLMMNTSGNFEPMAIPARESSLLESLKEPGSFLRMVQSGALESNGLAGMSPGTTFESLRPGSPDSWEGYETLDDELIHTALDLDWIRSELAKIDADTQLEEDSRREDSRSVAPYLPVKMEVLNHAFMALREILETLSKPFVDLGSGDGRVAIQAASFFNTIAIGYELDPKLLAESRKNAELKRVDCTFVELDFMADLSWAERGKWGCIFVNILPDALDKLEKTLLSLDCPIICMNFALPSAQPSGGDGGMGWTMYNVPGNVSPSFDASRTLRFPDLS